MLEPAHSAEGARPTRVGAGTYQRRVAHMRLLGEAYNYRLLTSGVVFDTLYLLLSFGHEDAESFASLDPPTSYFRIRRALRPAPNPALNPT